MNAKLVTTTLLFSVFVACGGAIAQDLGDGGDLSDGGTADGGGSDAGRDANASDALLSTCNKLQLKVEALRPRAQECCFTCNAQQCDLLVDGLCCPISVTSRNATNVMAFADAVRAFKDAECHAPCPDSLCRTAPSMLCQMSSSCLP